MTIPMQTQGSQPYKHDIYATTLKSKVELFNLFSAFGASGEDGKITLPSGREIDLSTMSGLTVYTAYLQLVQAQNEFADNILTFIKNHESKLGNLMSS